MAEVMAAKYGTTSSGVMSRPSRFGHEGAVPLAHDARAEAGVEDVPERLDDMVPAGEDAAGRGIEADGGIAEIDGHVLSPSCSVSTIALMRSPIQRMTFTAMELPSAR